MLRGQRYDDIRAILAHLNKPVPPGDLRRALPAMHSRCLSAMIAFGEIRLTVDGEIPAGCTTAQRRASPVPGEGGQ